MKVKRNGYEKHSTLFYPVSKCMSSRGVCCKIKFVKKKEVWGKKMNDTIPCMIIIPEGLFVCLFVCFFFFNSNNFVCSSMEIIYPVLFTEVEICLEITGKCWPDLFILVSLAFPQCIFCCNGFAAPDLEMVTPRFVPYRFVCWLGLGFRVSVEG